MNSTRLWLKDSHSYTLTRTAQLLMRHFITFTCYGAHLHGDEAGSVDRHYNLPESRLLSLIYNELQKSVNV